jgi:hypothetical protein
VGGLPGLTALLLSARSERSDARAATPTLLGAIDGITIPVEGEVRPRVVDGDRIRFLVT